MLNPGVPRGRVSLFAVAVLTVAFVFLGVSAGYSAADTGATVNADRPDKVRPERPDRGEDKDQAKQELKCDRAEQAVKDARKQKRRAKKQKKKAKGKKAKRKANRKFKRAKSGLAAAKIRVERTCSTLDPAA